MNEDIIRMAKELNELYKTMYVLYSPEVNRIINNKITDIHTIESCLDNLLNAPTDDCYELFLKLCSYYRTINKLSADDYLKVYKELYLADDIVYEEKSITKKKK